MKYKNKLLRPVSYTHLDVYKRQTLNITDIEDRNAESKERWFAYSMPIWQYKLIGQKSIRRARNRYRTGCVFLGPEQVILLSLMEEEHYFANGYIAIHI